MGRTGVAISVLAVAGAVGVGIVLGTDGLSSARTSAASNRSSPSCLPATLQHSARLADAHVDVSPAPETDTANPGTQISFLGVPVTEIHAVSAVGERSGDHSGQLRAYSQGDGGSFVPDSPFDAGERVLVRAVIGAGPGAKRIEFGFRVDAPYSTAGVPEFPNPQATASEYQSFRTLPGAQAPTLTVTTPDHDPAAGDIFTTNGPGPGQYGALIYTPQGRLVWFDKLSGGLTAEDLSVQYYQGQPVLTFWQGKVLSLGFGQGEDLVLNSNYQTIARILGGNGLRADLHDFQLASDNVAYITAYNPIRCDLSSLKGAHNGVLVDNAVQEIDMRTGLVRWEWHSLDHVGPQESQTAPPSGATPWDWFHVNSIDPQQDGDLFISARSTWAGYLLEAGSGNILWRLGGSRSSFKMAPGTETAWQHDGRILPDGEVTFFDNGSNPPVHHQSRGVRIVLDFKTHEARLGSVYTHPSPLLAVSQGNVQTLQNGNTVVDYGALPEISEYAGDGSLLFDAALPSNMASYRGFRSPWNGHPLTPPVVLANLNVTGEETIAHMSWNGATGVASWRVLAGAQPSSLKPQSTIAASGFESVADLPEKFAFVAVQALGSNGQVLRTSPAEQVTSYAASFG
jgi:hypothetical protein